MAKKRETAEGEAPAGEAAAPAAPRMSVQLTDDGNIAWDRIRDTTKAQLKKALSDPNVSAKLGIAEGAIKGEVVDAFDPSLCGVLYDSLSTGLVGLARWRGGYTEEQANVLRFNEQEKAVLGGPTAKVLNKYAVSFGKYQDEIALGLLLTTIITGKVSALRKTATVIQMAPQRQEEPSTGA